MFNQTAVIKNKNRSANFIANSEFFNFIRDDLADRIQTLDKDIKDVLEVSYVENQIMSLRELFRSEAISGDYDYINPSLMRLPRRRKVTPLRNDVVWSSSRNDEYNNKFDLVYFPFGLHWVNDVQKFFADLKSMLKSNGIFICNFPVTGSLTNLKTTLFLAEESTGNQHFPHISPFIRFEDVPPLLKQAGFIENIIDCEILMLEHESPIALMKWLKNIGESNSLINRNHYSINKLMHKFLSNFTEPFFEDQINLVTLIASSSKGIIKLK